jgi:protein tyrosine phosphatase (PTP) superfamily phosphohydrolase (DUF442 family)
MIRELIIIDERLSSSGQPAREELAGLGAQGYQVVINLATAQSDGAVPEEGEILARQGVAYGWIPVEWEAPRLDDVARFFAAMEEHAGEKTLVHCALNKRASAFVYLYRTLRLGVAHDEAAATMQAIWTPDGSWAQLIAAAEARWGTPQ